MILPNFLLGIVVFFNLCKHKVGSNLVLSAYYAFLSMTIVVLARTIAGLLLEYVIDLDIFIIWLLLFAVCYPLSRYIGIHLHRTYVQLSSEIKRKFATFGLAISALIFLLSYANMFLLGGTEDDQTLLLAVIIGIFFVATAMTAAYSLSQQKQAEELLKGEAEKDLENHTRQLEIEYNDMRSFKHDFRNLLFALLAYDDINELKAQLAKSLAYAEESLQNLDSVMSRLNQIQIAELKGLLSVKFAHAQALGIEIKLNIAEPIRDIPLNRLDLCRLAGIIVDNAIEELPSEITLAIIIDENETLIICSNPIATPPPVSKIFEEGYSTKGKHRGLGLPNLRRICKENKNLSYTVNTDNKEFSLILAITEVDT